MPASEMSVTDLGVLSNHPLMTAGFVPDSHPFFKALFECREVMRFEAEVQASTSTADMVDIMPAALPSSDRELRAHQQDDVGVPGR